MTISTWLRALMAFMCFSTTLTAQVVFIPDANFKSVLVSNPQINKNGDSEIQTSEAETFTGTINAPNLGIEDLTGIEAFTAVSRLYVNNNLLGSLNVTSNTALVSLRCNNNQLTSLDVSKNTRLTELYCYVNQIGSLDVTMLTALQHLYAFQNGLTEIDLTQNTALRQLKLDFNLLSELDLNVNTALTYIDVKQNQLKTLKVRNGNNTSITYFNAFRNVDLLCVEVDDPAYSEANWTNVEAETQFSTDCDQVNEDIVYIPDPAFKSILVGHKDINLNRDSEIQVAEAQRFGGSIFAVKRGITDLTGLEAFTALRELHVYENNLSTIDVSSNTELRVLRFDSNPVASIDLSHNPHLETLHAHNTPITTLDLSANPALKTLWCFDSQLTSLDLTANMALVDVQVNHNQLTSLELGSHPDLRNLYAYSNQLTTIDISQATGIVELFLQQNKLTSIEITNHSSLRSLNVADNMITSLDMTGKPQLRGLSAQNNRLSELDLSTNISLTRVTVFKNSLTVLNLKNGNNTRIFDFDATRNPNLLCIQVDDPAWAEANWLKVDAQATFSVDCGYEGPDIVNIPDPAFRARLIQIGVDTNHDEKIQYTEAEAWVTHMNLDGAGILDPTGVEAFVNTPSMNWEHNDIERLDLRQNTGLRLLDCGYMSLTELWINPQLETLDCYSNNLSNLATLRQNNSLKYIDMSDNNISYFKLSEFDFAATLENFLTAGNPIYNLDLTGGTNLKRVAIANSYLMGIDLSAYPVLANVSIWGNNQLTFVNIENGNNTNMEVEIFSNPVLECVEVDNAEYARENFDIQADTRISTDCDGSEAIVSIPDQNFKRAVVNNAAINTNGDSEIQVSEAHNYDDMLNLFQLDISDLTGIEHFINITALDVSGNNLTELFLNHHDNLRWLFANNNEIAAFSIYDCASLSEVECNGNQMQSLLLPPNLREIYASDNLIATVNIGAASNLIVAEFRNNRLTSLDLRDNLEMKTLIVENNSLTWLNIPLAHAGGLIELEARNNDLTCIQVDDPAYAEAQWGDDVDDEATFNTNCEGDPEIVYIPDPNLKAVMLAALDGRNGTHPDNVPDGEVQYFEAAEVDGGFSFPGKNVRDLTGIHALVYVEYIDCSNNLLTSITDMNGATGLDCSNNQITEITAELSHVQYLNASNNRLTSLPDMPSMFYGLQVQHNELTSIDIPAGRHAIEINASFNRISSIAINSSVEALIVDDNLLTSLDASQIRYLSSLHVRNNRLTSLKVKNVSDDQSTGMHLMDLEATGNTELTCIEVDDVNQAEADWRDNVDPQANFSEDCSAGSGLRIAVSPNPTMGKLTIESSDAIDEVVIFDGISGGLISSEKGNELDVSYLRNGLYFLKVRSGDKEITTRIVKE
jgi:hypothetical protein